MNCPGGVGYLYMNYPGDAGYLHMNCPGGAEYLLMNCPGGAEYLLRNCPGGVGYLYMNCPSGAGYLHVNCPGGAGYLHMNCPGGAGYLHMTVQVVLGSCSYKICRDSWNLTHHIPISAALDRLHNGKQLVALDIRTGAHSRMSLMDCCNGYGRYNGLVVRTWPLQRMDYCK